MEKNINLLLCFMLCMSCALTAKSQLNKVEVKNQKYKTKKNIRKNKYNSKSLTKNTKRENEQL